MLLVMTSGSPVLTLEQVATIRNISPRTLLNQIYSKECPINMWKDGGSWFAHVSDVASWIDAKRAEHEQV